MAGVESKRALDISSKWVSSGGLVMMGHWRSVTELKLLHDLLVNEVVGRARIELGRDGPVGGAEIEFYCDN